eukprot:103328_1
MFLYQSWAILRQSSFWLENSVNIMSHPKPKQLTNNLEEYFFGNITDDHSVNDYVIWCCWKNRRYEILYRHKPFNILNEFQQLTFEGFVSLHFDNTLRNKLKTNGSNPLNLNRKEVKSKQNIQRKNRKKKLDSLKCNLKTLKKKK